MAIPKWLKITIWIVGFVCLTTLLAFLGAYWIYQSGGYIRRNPKKIIAHWERVFETDFPDDIQDVKTATAFLGWDNGHTSYIMKFIIDPNSLKNFVKLEKLKPYNHDSDERDTDILPRPKWYTQPIQRGKIGEVSLSAPKYHASYSANILIDTSNENSFVVYMGGEMP